MSTPPPPPGFEPTGGPFGQPMVPPPPPSVAPAPPPSPQGIQPPPGYVAYGAPIPQQRMLRQTRGLRIATIVLIWVATAATGVQMLTILNRRSVWDDPSSSFSDLVAADDAVAGSVLFYVVAALATVIVLSIWTLRAVGNSQALGVGNLRPGLACGGWYIPFGNAFVPYIQIRRATRGLDAKTLGISLWQAAWIAMVVGGVISNSTFSDPNAFEPASVRAELSAQASGAVITFVAAVVAAIAATLATKSLDDAVAARAGR